KRLASSSKTGRISRAISTSCERKRLARLIKRRRRQCRGRRPPPQRRNRRLRLRARPPWPQEQAISSVSTIPAVAKLETRHSHGLEQFCSSLEEQPGLSILDLAGASQQTVSFLTNYGHRIYSDDFVHQLDQCFGDGDFYQNQSNPLMSGKFLDT